MQKKKSYGTISLLLALIFTPLSMKTIALEAYNFSELTEKAKEKASQYHEPFCQYDFNETIKAIENIFPIANISIDGYFQVSATIHDQDEEDQKTKAEYIALAKYPNETELPLTGTYSDHSFISSLPDDKKLTREDFEYALQKFTTAYQKQYEYELSDEALSEHFDLNEIFFLKDGSIA